MGDCVEISSALMMRAMRWSWISTQKPDGKYALCEHCGILRGRGQRVTTLDRVGNVAGEPENSFEIDPGALIAAYKAERRKGALSVLGFWHTHPRGDCWPSRRDADCAAPDGKLWLIAATSTVRIWRAVERGEVHGRFDPVRFNLVTGKSVERGILQVQHVDHGRTDLEVDPASLLVLAQGSE